MKQHITTLLDCHVLSYIWRNETTHNYSTRLSCIITYYHIYGEMKQHITTLLDCHVLSYIWRNETTHNYSTRLSRIIIYMEK